MGKSQEDLLNLLKKALNLIPGPCRQCAVVEWQLA